MKHATQKSKELIRDRQMTEAEAVEYARKRHGFTLPKSRLQQSRAGRCSGPKYIKKDGFHVCYTRRFIDEYVNANKPRIIDPTDRMAETS